MNPETALFQLTEAEKDGLIPKGEILLIGEGTGRAASYLLQKGGYFIVGVEREAAIVKTVREFVSEQGFFGYFQSGDPAALPVEDDYFDGVCDFVGAPESEVRRILRRGGVYFRFGVETIHSWKKK